MNEEHEPQSHINVSFGDVHGDGQFVVGHHINAIQNVGLTPAEIKQVTEAFEDFHTRIAEQAPPEVRDAAIAQASELKDAVSHGDLSRLKRAALWFARNAPRLGEAVVSLALTPIVGQLVGVAGNALVAELGLSAPPGDDA